ncbi:response regulator [Streptomyces sp. AN091965]|uniref:response regulator n=1 Tax=Streptomyces sp. AN091965 TaxID=2927803 RepID=UPI001F618254|nr:response regulator transcription factor [Streptomyces sp. AN091965]MCI3932698.1 response regulator transcription factor [Streptomyces sp. AN091965]
MLSVALVDDEEIVRVGMRRILDSDPVIQVVAEADSGQGALDLVRRHRLDVLAANFDMPGMTGLHMLSGLRGMPDAPPVLLLTSFATREVAYAALRAGAGGLALKRDAPSELIRHVHTVAQGHMAVSSSILQHFVRGALACRDDVIGADERRLISTLSAREHEIFLLLGEGLTNADMANRLHTSEGTMKSYVSRVLAKVEVPNRTRAALLAARFTRWRRDQW